MINFDNIDLKILKENFDDEMISKINSTNVSKIFEYLKQNKIYYAKDLFLSSLDLFLLPADQFIKQFENLKMKLGADYVAKLGNDMSNIEIMYED